MIGGEFVVLREEVFSPRGEEQERRAERGYSPLLPLTPVLRCVIFALWRELTHTQTCAAFSLSLSSGQGDKL